MQIKVLGMLCLAAALLAQPASKSVLGVVQGFRPESLEMEVKPDQGEALPVKFGPATIFQRIAPGERDLSKAEKIEVTAIATGDRVLVSFGPDSTEARRIIVMSATDISKRNDADRQDWQRRGLAGVVASKKDKELTLRARGLQGETISTVVVNEKTTFKRYSTGSVKFADAKSSKLSEVRPGDQLRARGTKSADGLRVEAEEVVFGTFQTRAGTVESINAEAKTISVKDSATQKTFVVTLAPDSQLKAMPAFGGPGRMMGGGGPPPGGGQMGPPGGGGPRMMRGPGGPGGPGGPPDFAQMIERMPAITIDQLKQGETIVVSSTQGAKKDELTAIILLSNAGRLVEMAARAGADGGGQRPGGMGGPGMGMGMGGGLELPTMMP